MIIRILTAICGVAVIYLGFLVKNDKTGKYSTSLKENYTDASVAKYLKNSFTSEMFFGSGLIIGAIFGSGIGYWIGALISLMGIILLFVFMKDLKKRNIPYRKNNKK